VSIPENEEGLSNLLREERRFPPSDEFSAQANVGVKAYDEAASDRLEFWSEQARRLDWSQPWQQTLDWSDAPFAQWFVGGKLNVAANCVDRHVEAGNGDRVAIYFEHHLLRSPARSQPSSECTNGVRNCCRRQGSDLLADDSAGGRCDAGLCPHRRDALCRVRWVLG